MVRSAKGKRRVEGDAGGESVPNSTQNGRNGNLMSWSCTLLFQTVVAIRAAGRRVGRELELGVGSKDTEDPKDDRILTFTQVRNGLTNKLREFDEDVQNKKPSWLTLYQEKEANEARERRRRDVEVGKEKRMR
jgi:hypothetical protein